METEKQFKFYQLTIFSIFNLGKMTSFVKKCCFLILIGDNMLLTRQN
jgi:hypothetical protein